MAKRLTVVVSQGQSAHPRKRKLEEQIVAELMLQPGIDVTVIPHLYDLPPESTGLLALQGISGNLVVISWLYERATRWVLDRHDIRGQEGKTLLQLDSGDEESSDDSPAEEASDNNADEKSRVIEQRPVAHRKIWCLDLRASQSAEEFLQEIQRITQESKAQVVDLLGWVGGNPAPEAMQRYLHPTNTTSLGEQSPASDQPSTNGQTSTSNGRHSNGSPPAAAPSFSIPTTTNRPNAAPPTKLPTHVTDELGHASPERRWYPVIDFSRCTNCMECIDFCLFGVYGVDGAETILVEQPDNCRKGCPACSRVCPENAIIFPQHKSPAIAGSPEVTEGLKIDLSKLFGAPQEGKSAEEIAALERDEQLLIAGRDPVSSPASPPTRLPKRQQDKPSQPRDELDDLVDQLDSLDL